MRDRLNRRDRRARVGEPGGWFRVGVVSATLLTPLVTRWQALRAAERARALWDARQEASWPWAHRPAPEQAPPSLARRANVSASLWLVGVGVGLVIAGTGAYVLLRRRMAALEELPVELPMAGDGAEERVPDGHARALRANGNQEALVVRGGETRTSTAPRRTDEGISIARPGGEAAAAAGAPSTDAPPRPPVEPAPASMAQLREETGGSTTSTSGAAAGIVEPERAPFIGNIHTLVYHEAGDENLPAEENRVYFASREEAEEAGFRPDEEEAPGL